jgi:hypothetical protein
MCWQLEIWKKILPNFGSSWIELAELSLEMMFLTYFNNIFVAESIKIGLEGSKNSIKTRLHPNYPVLVANLLF